MLIDVRPDLLEEVKHILQEHVPDCAVYAFGSRVNWTAKDTSDLDLCIKGNEKLNLSALSKLKEAFSFSRIPYQVDVVDWYRIDSTFKNLILPDLQKIDLQKNTSIEEWHEYTIDELKANSTAAIAIGPFGSRMKSDCYVENGIPIIRGTNISNTQRFTGDFVFITPKKAEELGSSNVYEGDLVFPHRGSIGEVGIVTDNPTSHYVLSSSLMKLTCNRDLVNPLFLFYYFRSEQGRHELLKNASTVGTPGIGTPLSSLKSIKVKIPKISEQQKIIAILSVLDKKIELNRQINETMEALAKALFRSWFVDFDPVRAKAEGNKPKGLSSEIACLFPDEFKDSELGEIPKGWEISNFGCVSKCFDFKRIPLSKREREKKPGNIPYYGATSIMDYVDEPLFEDIYLLLGEDGSVLKDNGCPFVQYIWGKAWVNNHAHVLKGKNTVSTEHLMLFIQDQNISGYVTGAVQLKLNQGNMNRIPFIKSTEMINKKFEKIINPLFAKYRTLSEMSLTLTKIRDLLLPKLMSGEISVRHAKEIVEELS